MFSNISNVYIICAVFMSILWPLTRANTKAKISSPISEPESLVESHKNIMNYLKNYVLKEEERLYQMKKIIDVFKKEHDAAMKDVSNYIFIPMNAFTVIKRLTTDLEGVKTRIRLGIENNKELASMLKKAKNLPTPEDLIDSALELHLLQAKYKLDIQELAEGRVNGEAYSLPMSAGDCYVMSRVSYSKEDYHAAECWVMEAIIKREYDQYPYTQGVDLWRAYLDDIRSMIKKNAQDSDQQTGNDKTYTNKVSDPKLQEVAASLCRGELEIPHNVTKK